MIGKVEVDLCYMLYECLFGRDYWVVFGCMCVLNGVMLCGEDGFFLMLMFGMDVLGKGCGRFGK